MDIRAREPRWNRVASAAVIWPIAGMVGGLAVGAVRARMRGLIELAELACVIKWGVTGFFAGLAFVLLLALRLRRGDAISTRWLMALVAIAGTLAWFFARVLFDAIGYEGF